MLKKIDIFRRMDPWGRQHADGLYPLNVFLYRDDERIKTTKTTDGYGNPFIPGSYKEYWNPI